MNTEDNNPNLSSESSPEVKWFLREDKVSYIDLKSKGKLTLNSQLYIIVEFWFLGRNKTFLNFHKAL